MKPRLPTDNDTNSLFDDVVNQLHQDFGYSADEASELVQRYYAFFRDPDQCSRIGVPVQDDDFFFHESAGGMALRVHYYMGLRKDPNPHSFVEWRTSLQRPDK